VQMAERQSGKACSEYVLSAFLKADMTRTSCE
jgi:hypothetical protein